MRHIVIMGLLLVCSLQLKAQIDPTLAGMVYLYTEKAEDQLKAQERAMLMQTTGHIWTREEVEGTTDIQRKFNDYLTTDIQRKFNDYLDSFRDIISYAAQIYGFYHEVGKLAENMGSLNDQLRSHAGNAIAVALTPNRNRIYQELILGSVEIVNDIRQVCLSDTKMTEKQRIELVFGIRPKLKAMNRKLRHLTLAVKYTSLADVWATIDEGARPQKADKAEIARAAMRRWRRNGDL